MLNLSKYGNGNSLSGNGNPTLYQIKTQTMTTDPYTRTGLGLSLPSPADYGLPDQYTKWRKYQYATIEKILDSPKRFFGLCASTGAGKSLSAMAAAMMSGRRTVILTSTLGLQNQVAADFSGLAMDIRGMSNYGCVAAAGLGLAANTTVAEAPCQMGYRCSLRFGGGCEYYDKYRQAQHADLIVTNYQCWMYDALKQDGSLHIPRSMYEAGQLLGPSSDSRIPVDMLIADEGNLASGELERYIGVDVSRREVLHLGLEWPDSGHDLEWWKDWAAESLSSVETRLSGIEKRLAAGANNGNGNGDKGWSRDVKSLRDIKRKLQRLSQMESGDEWVMQEVEGEEQRYSKSPVVNMKSVQFSPLNPARYAESVLWRGVEKIVLMSATLRLKTLELLGIPASEAEFLEVPSTFPVERRPVILVPSVQMNYKNEQDDRLMMKWLARLDAVIGPRVDLGRKGVIHAVSYKRAIFIRDNSEYGHLMMIHNSRDRAEVVERFRRSDGPSILVSPSVDTGYDFHGDQCRFQVLVKVPFQSTQDKLVKERQARDAEYGIFIAAQTVVQMTGRGMRSETDWCECICLDDNFFWWMQRVRKFMPQWWLDAVVKAEGVPKPLQF